MSEAPRNAGRGGDSLAVCAVIAIVALSFIDVLAGARVLFARDLSSFHFPMKAFVREVMRAGSLPLWNPRFSGGQPAAANPNYEIFYPGQWPILLPDFVWGFQFHIVLHVVLAGVAMYAFIRSLGTRPAVAASTALTFALSGALLSLTNLLPSFFSLAWLPALLMFVRRFLIHRRARDFAAAALVLGMQSLICDPGSLVQSAGLIAAYAAYRTFVARSDQESRWSPLLAVAAVGAAGFALGAIQLLPTLDHARDTQRGAGFTFERAAYWSLPPVRLAELVQPHALGTAALTVGPAWAARSYRRDEKGPFLQNLYSGVFVLVVLIGGSMMRDRRILLLLALAGAALLVAFGDATPLFGWLWKAGLFRGIRFPERFAALAMFSAITASGLALERLVADERSRRVTAAVAAILFAVLTGFAVTGGSVAFVTDRFANWSGFAAASPEFELWRTGWLRSGLVAGAIAGTLLLRRRLSPNGLALAIGVIALADLAPLNREFAPRESRDFFDPPPAVAKIDPSRGRIFHQADWHDDSPTARRYDTHHQDLHWLRRNALRPRWPAAWGLDTIFETDIDKTNVRWSEELLDTMWSVRGKRSDWAEVFMDMGAVGYRTAFHPYDAQRILRSDRRLFEPIAFIPVTSASRYRFAEELVSATSGRDMARHLIEQPAARNITFITAAAFRPASGRVLQVAERPNAVDVIVETNGRAFLVASNTWHRGWSASIDGAAVPIIRTNIAFQGIEVPPGRHRVVFRFRNGVILIGAAISLFSAGLLTWIAITKRALPLQGKTTWQTNAN
ncbi:MAG: YfhO family protein [Thermoanaerobaculia bacterium]|nr:YfhO family protein [Thermoanaerobaculia bacterium]